MENCEYFQCLARCSTDRNRLVGRRLMDWLGGIFSSAPSVMGNTPGVDHGVFHNRRLNQRREPILETREFCTVVTWWRTEIKFHDHAHTSFVPALTRRLVEHHGVCAATGAPASNSLHSTFFRRSDPPSRPNKNLKTQNWIHEHQFLLRRVLLVFHQLLLPFSLFCATCSQSSRLDVAIAVFL